MPGVKRRNTMRAFVVLCLVVAACSGADSTSEVDVAARELAAHEIGWEEQRLRDYTWTYTAGTFWDFRGEVTVTVDGLRVVDVVHDDPGGRPVQVLTARDLFALAQTALDWDSADIEFDPATCLPQRMYLDEIEGVADDEYSFTLIDFSPAAETTGTCEPIASSGDCPDLTGTTFVGDRLQAAEGGGTHRPSFEFLAADVIEYSGSDYFEEITLRCEGGALVEIDQWANLGFVGDNVVIERGNERLVSSRETAGSACEGLVGSYSPSTDDPLILELEVKRHEIVYRLTDGNISTIGYDCTGDVIFRRTHRGTHLEDGRIFWDTDLFAPPE